MLGRRVGPPLDPEEVQENFAADIELGRRMTRSSIGSTPSSEWIPGRKVEVITTNTPRAVVPRVEKPARGKRTTPESLKEQKARLQREIQELEEKLGKK